MSNKIKAPLVARCTDPDVKQDDLEALYEAGKEISFTTFARFVDTVSLAKSLGYSTGRQKGLHLKDDYHVRYKRSMWQGNPCYWMVWSAIDHVFQYA